MADTARLDAYANWIRANQDKAGTPDYVKVTDAYRQMREQQQWEQERPATGSAAVDGTSAGLSGFNKGVATVLGGPVDLVNAGMRAVGLPTSDRPFMGSDQIKGWMKDTGMVRPNYGYETAERIGEGTGMGVGMAVPFGMASRAMAARNASPTVTALFEALGPSQSATGTVAGQTVGSALQVGGENLAESMGAGDLGQTLGGIGASAGIPLSLLALKNTAGRGVAAMLRRPETPGGVTSQQAYDTLVANGITPTPGLVGGGAAARMENAATYVPFFKHGEAVRDRSFNEFQTALRSTADEIAGAPGYSQEILPQPTVGARFIDNAQQGYDKTMDRISTRQDNLENAIGPQTLLPVDQIIPQIQSISETAVDGQLRPRTSPALASGIDNEISKINAVRVPEHPTLDGLLQTEINARQAMLENATPGTATSARLEAELEALRGKVDANQKAPYEAIKDIRTEAGTVATPTGPAAVLNEGQIGQARDTYTGIMQDAANKAGQGLEFQLANEEYSRLMSKKLPLAEGGDIPYLDQLRSMETGQNAYNNVMGEGKWERADVLRRNNPEVWPTTAADIVMSNAEAPVRNQTKNIDVSPMAYNTWWKSLSPEMQTRLANFDPQVQSRLQGLSDTGQLFLDRSGTMNFSNTAPSAATAVTMGGIFSRPIETAKALASSFGASMLATSPEMAKMIGQRYSVGADPQFTKAMIDALKGTARATEVEQQ